MKLRKIKFKLFFKLNNPIWAKEFRKTTISIIIADGHRWADGTHLQMLAGILFEDAIKTFCIERHCLF